MLHIPLLVAFQHLLLIDTHHATFTITITFVG
jgi:hypothetical protein